MAASRKESKYSCLPANYLFQPIALETHGSINSSGLDFLIDVGRRLSAVSGDVRETSYLFKRLSIIVQRFNSALIHESFGVLDVDLDL